MTHNIDLSSAAPEEIEALLGERLLALRLSQNMTQSALAKSAGVSRRTITRLESGDGVSVDTLIRVLRALGVVDRLAALLPNPSVRPIDRVRMHGQTRQRARTPAPSLSEGWQWDDEPSKK